MEIFFISFFVFVLAALIMALGAIAGGTPITAGCGNAGKLNGPETECEICGASRDGEAS